MIERVRKVGGHIRNLFVVRWILKTVIKIRDSRTARILKSADPEPVLLLTGFGTLLTGIILVLAKGLFYRYPGTFGFLALAAPQWAWGITLITLGALKLCSVEHEGWPTAWGTCIVAMVLWWSMTFGIVFVGQVIPLIALTATKGIANSWLCIRLARLISRERYHRAATGDTGSHDTVVRNGDLFVGVVSQKRRGYGQHRIQKRPNGVQQVLSRKTEGL